MHPPRAQATQGREKLQVVSTVVHCTAPPRALHYTLAYVTLCHIGYGSDLYANAYHADAYRHAATCSSACYNVLSRALHYALGCAVASVTSMLLHVLCDVALGVGLLP